MPYTAGTQSAQASPAKYFMESIVHAPLLAAGFTYVEEWVNGANVARVYKSPGASNYFGQDWYLITYRGGDADTTMSLKVSEQYNTGTHKATKYPAIAGNGVTPASDFSYNDATGQLPSNTNPWISSNIGLSASGFQYWLSLTADRVVIGTRISTTDYASYGGLYDDLQPISISPFPLIIGPLSTASAQQGAASREPNTTTSASYPFQLSGLCFSPMGASYGGQNWTTTEQFSGLFWLGRFVVPHYSYGQRQRGYLRDVWYGPSGGVNGDTLTASINGVSKNLICLTNQSARSFIDTAL